MTLSQEGVNLSGDTCEINAQLPKPLSRQSDGGGLAYGLSVRLQGLQLVQQIIENRCLQEHHAHGCSLANHLTLGS